MDFGLMKGHFCQFIGFQVNAAWRFVTEVLIITVYLQGKANASSGRIYLYPV
ncbi:MAG: hypothetical protein HC908_16960 [Calothrix sp. SM1_7_51]|nr:hypothetical protein [Calothrix sp. SM1_7_51]